MSNEQKRQLQQVLSRFADLPLLVVGDLILDQFVWGRVERISPEAPVPVVEVLRETLHLGGAANVAANLAVLGARPLLVGITGSDEASRRLKEELQRRGISPQGMVEDPERMTTIKTRILAHHQQVCRTDRESRKPVEGKVLEQIQARCEGLLEEAGAVILSDYSKGVLSRTLIQSLIRRARGMGKFVTVDPKTSDFTLYQGASLITPNKKEAEGASGIAIVEEASLIQAGRKILESGACHSLLITRGEEGMTLFEPGGHVHIPTVAREVFDVTGAGDTVVAFLTLGVAAGASLHQAAILANHAAGVVVGKLGTAAATVEEVSASLDGEGG